MNEKLARRLFKRIGHGFVSVLTLILVGILLAALAFVFAAVIPVGIGLFVWNWVLKFKFPLEGDQHYPSPPLGEEYVPPYERGCKVPDKKDGIPPRFGDKDYYYDLMFEGYGSERWLRL